MRLSIIATGLFLAVSSQATLAFDLSSTDMKAGGLLSEQQVANGFGCSGGNLSPQLAWNPPPREPRAMP